MKKLLTLCLLAVTMCVVAQQKKVAVYVTGDDSGVNKVLGSKLVSAFARSEEFSAIERTESFLAELSKEQNYQRTGAVNDSTISRLGKQFGVQYVCVAEVTDVFGEKFVSARLIDAETAEVIDAYECGGQIISMNSCVAMANEIASKLSHTELSYFSIPSLMNLPSQNNALRYGNCNLSKVYASYIQKIYDGRDISDDENAKQHMFKQVSMAIETISREYGLIGIFDDAYILYKGKNANDVTKQVLNKLNLL